MTELRQRNLFMDVIWNEDKFDKQAKETQVKIFNFLLVNLIFSHPFVLKLETKFFVRDDEELN